jgi:hypothetical protein
LLALARIHDAAAALLEKSGTTVFVMNAISSSISHHLTFPRFLRDRFLARADKQASKEGSCVLTI